VDYHAPDADTSVATEGELQKLEPFLEALREMNPNERHVILAADLNTRVCPLGSDWAVASRGQLDFIAFGKDTAEHGRFFLGGDWEPEIEERGLSDHPVVWAEFYVGP